MFTDIHIFKYNHEVVLALEKKKKTSPGRLELPTS